METNTFFIQDTYVTDDEKKAWRDRIRHTINTRIVNISFEKADKSIRVMKCTTCFDNIPKEFHPETKEDEPSKKRVINKDELCTVFDLEANAWRSFRWAKLTSLEIQHENLVQNKCSQL